MAEERSMLDIIKSQIEKEESLPVLSPKALQLQKEATRADPDFDIIIQQIKTDPTLTGEVLKAANSAFYKGLHHVDNIKDAVLRLGQVEIVNIIITVIHKQNFKSSHPDIRKYQNRLWAHSVACAMGSSWTARHLAMDHLVSKAFIGGLLHDMGKLYLLTALEKLLQNKDVTIKPTVELMETIMNNLHAEQGYTLLAKWNLPETYRIIARDHHTDSYNPSDLLLLIVRIVNEICLKIERKNSKEDLSGIISSKEADALGMTEIGVVQLEIFLEDLMASKAFSESE